MAKTPKAPPGPNVDADVIRELAALLEETGLAEIEVGRGDWKVRVAKDRAGTVVAAAPAPVWTSEHHGMWPNTRWE